MWFNFELMETKEQFEFLLQNIQSLEKSVDALVNQLKLNQPEKNYLGCKEACDLLGISKTTLYRLMKAGEITYTSVRGSRKFLRTDLIEYIENNRSFSFSKAFEGLKK